MEAVAERLVGITRAAGVALVINDHWEIAVRVGAAYCHLGQEDFFDAGLTHVSELRRDRQEPGTETAGPENAIAGRWPRLGLSTHSPDQARRAISAGADYIAIGPVYPTGTKPHAKPVTLDYVRWATANVGVPWFAIGGITLSNLDAVLAAGATRICVVSAILQSPDIVRACAEFKSRLISGAS